MVLLKAAQDIKNHRFLDQIDWHALVEKKIKMPYVPVVKLVDKKWV